MIFQNTLNIDVIKNLEKAELMEIWKERSQELSEGDVSMGKMHAFKDNSLISITSSLRKAQYEIYDLTNDEKYLERIFLFAHYAAPKPDSPLFEKVKHAYFQSWILAKSEEKAGNKAVALLNKKGWAIEKTFFMNMLGNLDNNKHKLTDKELAMLSKHQQQMREAGLKLKDTKSNSLNKSNEMKNIEHQWLFQQANKNGAVLGHFFFEMMDGNVKYDNSIEDTVLF